MRAGYQITGVILQRDDGVLLVSNRLENRYRLSTFSSVHRPHSAGDAGGDGRRAVERLSKPSLQPHYGIATVFNPQRR